MMDGQNAGTFKHAPLSNERQIRLLRLGDDLVLGATIHSFEQYSIDSTPPYTALSYVWGDSKPSAHLLLEEGEHINLCRNLAEFLCTLQFLRKTASKAIDLIWIDALCIDQTNLDERSCQVRLMRHIYEGAEQVLVWLGLETEDAAAAAAFIPMLAKKLESIDDAKFSSATMIGAECGVPLPVDPKWAALFRLVCQPWFKRIWVQQEIILASSVIMACGKHWIPWAALSSVAAALHDHQLENLFWPAIRDSRKQDVFVERVYILRNMHWARQAFQESMKPSLISNLASFSICEVTDPRDKIYSLLGISGAPGDLGFRGGWTWSQVDYRCTVEKLYISFAKSMLVGGQSSGLLACAGLSRPYSNLPTWVPDWRTYDGRCSLYERSANAG